MRRGEGEGASGSLIGRLAGERRLLIILGELTKRSLEGEVWSLAVASGVGGASFVGVEGGEDVGDGIIVFEGERANAARETDVGRGTRRGDFGGGTGAKGEARRALLEGTDLIGDRGDEGLVSVDVDLFDGIDLAGDRGEDGFVSLWVREAECGGGEGERDKDRG